MGLNANYLQFSLTAYRKIMLANNFSKNEVSFYGICQENDSLEVDDLFLPKQTVSSASVDIDDNDVALYCGLMAEAGYIPRQLTRVWIHTHPSGLLTPSGTDETTFNKILGLSDVAVMVIVEQGGEIAAWLQINNIIGVSEPVRMKIPVEVDWTCETNFDVKLFKEQFDAKVTTRTYGNNYMNGNGNYAANKVWHNNKWMTHSEKAAAIKAEETKTAAAKGKGHNRAKGKGKRGRPKGSKNKKTQGAPNLILPPASEIIDATEDDYCNECNMTFGQSENSITAFTCSECKKTFRRHSFCHQTMPQDRKGLCFMCDPTVFTIPDKNELTPAELREINNNLYIG